MKRAATLSTRIKVTIPAEIRKLLGFRPGESVMFDMVADKDVPEVTVRRSPTLEELAGSVPVPDEVRGMSWEQIRYRAWFPSGDRQ